MKTKLENIFAALSIVGLLVSLSPSAIAARSADNPEILAAAQNATTRSDHEAVAKSYEDAAAQMQAKVEEQKELLEHYEDKSYLYGRRAQDLQSHTTALVRHYEKAVKTNIQEAALHRQIASKLEEQHAPSGTQTASAADEL
ncbi:hypothetical protein [Nitrosospira sp. NpAV]|uniref:hypothetical protein n=1 Tax=Nitrosospira sp. NpAV TaxID=58133 RepID=UPI0005A14D30|nr:hypothetical protein [Nitrosospira sp. NpAV]KIO48329.1 hypothetical protein SQ11_11180 [Nitrosospira sp. NpAV]